MKKNKIGLWLIGAFGSVGSTAAIGLSAIARGVQTPIGMVTGLAEYSELPLDSFANFVVGGHDIRQTSFSQTIGELHERSQLFNERQLAATQEDLAAWSRNVCTGTIIKSGKTIAKLANCPEAFVGSPLEAIERIEKDLKKFQEVNQLSSVVVVNVASTEPPFQISSDHQELASLQKALKSGVVDILPASSIYAYAAIRAGFPYVNFTPSLGASIPALVQFAEQQKVALAGQDGKTGETLLKTVLAPMFAARNMHILSWVGHNILGAGDGQVLNDPENKSSKVKTKDAVLSSIIGYKPQTHVSIEYIESLHDWKTAWDHIHFEGFMGAKMTMQFTWQGCDSILAAPLVLDLARLVLLAQRRQEYGVLTHLACFFKNPQAVTEHDFFQQVQLLRNYLSASKPLQENNR